MTELLFGYSFHLTWFFKWRKNLHSVSIFLFAQRINPNKCSQFVKMWKKLCTVIDALLYTNDWRHIIIMLPMNFHDIKALKCLSVIWCRFRGISFSSVDIIYANKFKTQFCYYLDTAKTEFIAWMSKIMDTHKYLL